MAKLFERSAPVTITETMEQYRDRLNASRWVKHSRLPYMNTRSADGTRSLDRAEVPTAGPVDCDCGQCRFDEVRRLARSGRISQERVSALSYRDCLILEGEGLLVRDEAGRFRPHPLRQVA